MSAFNLLVILGSTASGKTKLAVELANILDGEILSADSRQVYKGLDIGSGKDLDEYQHIPYHLIDIVEPGYEYNIFNFQRDFITAFEEITARQKMPILAGGSALYVDSIIKGYRLIEVPENETLRAELAPLSQDLLIERLKALKPSLHNTTDLIDRSRLIRAIEIAQGELATPTNVAHFPNITPFIMAIQWERDIVKKRITERLKARLEQGLIEEVAQLNKQGVSWETLNFYGLEYRFVAQYLQGQINKNDMFQKLNAAIHQFSKKQSTWLRRLEKQGNKIHWLDGTQSTLEQAMKQISSAN